MNIFVTHINFELTFYLEMVICLCHNCNIIIKEVYMKRILITVLLLSSLVSTFLFAVDLKKDSGNYTNNSNLKIQSYSKAFKDGKFDKNKYIGISLNNYKNMVEYEASLTEKIYNILTDKQKKQLEKMLDS